MSGETMHWETVCRTQELSPNLGACAFVKNKQIAIFRVRVASDEKFYALDNYCPFGHANVLSRGLVGDLQGKIVVASPLYKHHYALDTGECLEDASVQVKVYPIRVENDEVKICVVDN